MIIQNRIKALEGITDTHWDNQRNKLVIYYLDTFPLDTIKVKVSGAIGDANLQRAVEEITLISVSEEDNNDTEN